MNILKKIYCRTYQLGFRVALPILPYRNPEQLNGIESIPTLLKEKDISSILLVVDGGVHRLGIIQPLEDLLQEENISYLIHEQNTPNPTIDDVEAARDTYYQANAMAIVAVGGGSSMDCAKACGARIARPKKPVSKMAGILKICRKTPLLITVPTTAGTGSEATLAAVITDAKTHHKYPINDFPLIPDYAVLEPKLTIGLPPFITATTGLDALTHAVEAYIGRSTNRFTRSMSEEAVILIRKHLREAVHNGQNEEARAGMLRAAYCAGAAFTRSYVGYVHGIAHSLGGKYGTPHGLANAVILPKFLDRYGTSCEKKLAKLSRIAGIASPEAEDEAASRQFIDWIYGMNQEFGLPETFEEIQEEDIHQMALYAAKESNPLYPVPRLMDASELEIVYRSLMVKVTPKNIEEIVDAQRTYFASGATLPLEARHDALRKLKASIIGHEKEINAALAADLGKCPAETYMCETGMTLSELSFMDSHIDGWARPHKVPSPMAQFHAKSFTVKNPYGVVLVMSPWNYPFMLTMEPLIGAIACGNCCVVKPSAYSPKTSAIIKTIIDECFPQEHVTVIEGGREENQALLKQKFDYIFFTGGVKVGKEVMRNAAEHLTPLTLELGGKSPVVIDATANLKLAAKRIAFGKLLNCGQTCVAPDYVLIDQSVEKEFIKLLTHQFNEMAGKYPLQNSNYVHMINTKHFDRVMGLMDSSKVVYGGSGDLESLRIHPTIMTGVNGDDPIMQEEIFGPILPIMTYTHIDEAVDFINSRPHPLACYLFTQDRKLQRRFANEVPFGGGCINDTIIHLATSHMGFGGVGGSGMGNYHGKKSFDTFSHEKSIVKKYTWIDMPVRYAPYTKLQEKLLRLFLR